METETIIVIIVVVITLIVAGVLAYYFFFQKKGNKTGESCTSNQDCASGHYCGGDGTCHLGPGGKSSGSDCTDSSQCEFGLTCTSGKCTSDNPPPPTNLIPSFNNAQVTAERNGDKYYLVVGPEDTSTLSQSAWSTLFL